MNYNGSGKKSKSKKRERLPKEPLYILHCLRVLAKTDKLSPAPDKVYAYVDTVAVWLGKKPRNSDLKVLKKSCGSCHVQQKSAQWNKSLRCRLHLHQPSLKSLQLLDDNITREGTTFLINQVDFAVDLIVPDQDQLGRLYHFIDRHVVKKWHGKQAVRYYQDTDTRYTSQQGWQCHQIVTYPQPRSRITGQPCVHLEWRARGKGPVESIGICDLEQLINFDHRGFWQKRLCLEEVNLQMLGRQFLGRSRAKKAISSDIYKNFDRHVGSLIGRAAATRDNGPTAQDIHDWCRKNNWFRPQTSMKKIDIEPYLPNRAL